MRRLVLPTLVIAAGMMLAGAPFASYSAGPMSPSYTGNKPSGSKQDIYPNTPSTGRPSTWPTQAQQPRMQSSDQAGTMYPDTPPTGRPGTWPTKPVNPNMTVVERVRQRIEQEFPNADISVMSNADQGVVTLLGLAKTKEQKKRAHEIAADTKGVKMVHDELGVIG